MPNTTLSTLGRGLRGAWRLLDATRRTMLNLMLLLLLGAVLWALLKPSSPSLQDKTALVLDIRGAVVEQRAGLNLRAQVLGMAQGEDNEQTQLRDVLAVLETAAKDKQISHAVLMLDKFSGGGYSSMATLRELAAAIERFKASGKPVYAWGSEYDQRQYFVAAHATQVWLHPMGSVLIEGFGRQRSYYKDLFDKVGIKANVIRSGKYKSAAEGYAANGPSAETLESEGMLWNTLWTSYTASVEGARKQPAGSVMAAIDSLPASLLAVQGNPAKWALQRKWVDALKTADEMRDLLIQQGAKDEDNKTFRQVGFADYLARIKPRSDGDAVGVVVAEGGISDGTAGPGNIGGLSTAKLIRQARDNDKIKALVLRVNSPGGSAFGSELVRRELELTRKAGKPVVVSMGNLAASGGYWISMAADEVIADETTITGSIGVVGLLPTAEVAMDKLGIRTGGATTTWMTTGYDPKRALDPRFAQLVQSVVDGTYRDFTTLVATARKSTPEKIHELAQGRVWAGKDAQARGLVDRLGSLGDAIGTAAKLGKLDADTRVEYIETKPGKLQRLLSKLGVSQTDLSAAGGVDQGLQSLMVSTGVLPPLAQTVSRDLGWLADVADRRKPFAATAHCLCDTP
jgi:protease-4